MGLACPLHRNAVHWFLGAVIMNPRDNEILIDAWRKETDAAEGVIQDAIKRSQDHAYELGLERGKLNLNKTQLVLEKMILAIDDMMVGKGTSLEQLDGIEQAYDEIKKLYEELSC